MRRAIVVIGLILGATSLAGAQNLLEFFGVVGACLLIGWVVCYRLMVAYRSYLRFRHVKATIIASQVIVGLTYLILFVYLSAMHL